MELEQAKSLVQLLAPTTAADPADNVVVVGSVVEPLLECRTQSLRAAEPASTTTSGAVNDDSSSQADQPPLDESRDGNL